MGFIDVRYFNVNRGGATFQLDSPSFNKKFLAHSTSGRYKYVYAKLKTIGSLAENDIFTIKESGNVIGFAIPGGALASLDHNFADDPLFGSYALHLLNWITKEDVDKLDHKSDQLEWSDLIDDQCLYLCICSSRLNINSIEDFFDLHFAPFAEAGLYKYRPGKISLEATQLSGEQKSITLRNKITHHPFLCKALFDLVPYEKESVFAFFYLWQAIESVMGEILTKKLTDFIEKTKKMEKIQFRNALDELNEFSKEKNRIGPVFQKPNTDLELSCDELIKNLSATSEKSLKDKIYLIRNHLFHRFAEVDDTFQLSIRQLVNNLHAYLIGYCLAQETARISSEALSV